MAGMINELIGFMEEQIVCYEYLLGLSKEKREAIINNNIIEIQKITDLENRLVSNNISIEKKRLAVIEDISYVLNFSSSNITISKILSLIEGHDGYNELLSVSTKMRDVIEQLKDSNDQNRVLINNSLEYIDFTMNAIKTSVHPITTTDESNMVFAASTATFFDAKQ